MNHIYSFSRCNSHGRPEFLVGRRNLILSVLSLLLLFFTGAFSVRAQETPPSEYQVKAAFLYNFGKFVVWPQETFNSATAPLVIGLFGGDTFNGDLARLVAGRAIGTHPVMVRIVNSPADLKKCQILFVSAGQAKTAVKILGPANCAGVLIVGENLDPFPDGNFMINFVRLDGKIRFQIDNETARSDGLTISSKLLALGLRAEK